ncbi:MAG: hypothetical protein KF752_01990 [Pirellulaceae bacterium]|nr:hypothetical protein [Pirellulaceae bacterium]
MSLHRQTWRWIAVVACLMVAPIARGQVHFDQLPFADPLEFKPDWQWFAPVDSFSLAELSPRKRANTGFFGTYDVTSLWVTRPASFNADASPRGVAGDFGWGHRVDVGFMRENDHGWLGSFRSMNVDQNHTSYFEIIDGNYDIVLAFIQEILGTLGEGTDSAFNYFNFPVVNSVNSGALHHFELNKTWRKRPYRYGGILEPLVGLRYDSFTDRFRRESFTLTEELEDPLDPDSTLVTFGNWESDRQEALNRMLGGQLGFRYFTHYHRWRLSTEFRGFMSANFQTNTRTFNFIFADLDNTDLGTFQTVQNYRTDQSLVWGFEARAEAAYQLTKYLAVRSGIDVVDFARGIWRGSEPTNLPVTGIPNRSNQHLFMAGLTFGIELNR